MSESLKVKVLKRASEILSELGVTDCDVIFTDFSKVARDPLKKAQGYHPKWRAHCDSTTRIIEINTVRLQDDDFSHWRNWDNIIAHEVGHIILNTPPVMTQVSEDHVGLVLARFQFELYNIAQDMTRARVSEILDSTGINLPINLRNARAPLMTKSFSTYS